MKRLVEAYSGYRPDSPEGRMVADMQDAIMTLEAVYEEVLADASENFQGANEQKKSTREGGVKYSIPYRDAIDLLADGDLDRTSNTHLLVSAHTPQVYIDKAGAKDQKIIMGWDIAYLAMNKSGEIPGNYHGLGRDVMKNLPEALKDPLFIVKQNNGRVAAVTEIVVKKNRSVVVSVEFDAFKSTVQDGENESDNYNIIVTAMDAKPNYLQNTILTGNIVHNKNNENPANFILRLKSLNKALPNDDLARSSNPSIQKDVPEVNRKFSYAGAGAATADLKALERAKELDAWGVDNESIRQQTGWFRGKDGKWRFEIDDSKMQYSPRGDLSFRKRNPGYARYRELLDKSNRYLLELSDEAPTESEQAELKRLSEIWRGTFQKPGRITEDALQQDRLEDYIQHDELFKAYPQLRDTTLLFADLPEGSRGKYDPSRNVITLSESLRRKPENTILHEIQHAIQSIEGFTPGASVEYWKEQRRDIVETIAGARKNLDLWLADIGYQEVLKRSLLAVSKREKTMEQHWRDMDEFKKNSKYARQIAACEQELAEFQRQYDEITHGMTAYEQYQNTAGEIEARNVAGRRNLTAVERKKTPPILGGEDTVFAEDEVRTDQAIGKTTDNKPFVTIDGDILAGVPRQDWVKTVTDNLKQKFPTGIIVGHNLISVDKQSRQEMTFSKYTRWLMNNDPSLYEDKLRATNNVDEIIKAATDWVNEGLNHPRKDKITDFARGNVLLDVGGRKYSAEVVVGTRKNGTMIMYDLLKITPTQFTEKEMNMAITENPSPEADRNTMFISDTNVAQDTGKVNKKSSDRDPMQEKAVKVLEKENARLREDVQKLNELVKLQKKLTGGKLIKPSSVEAAARVLKKNMGAKGGTKELAKLLGDFYGYIASGEELTWENVKEAAGAAADWLWENLEQVRNEYAADILKDLRGRSISLSQSQKAEAAVKYDSFSNWRKALFGSVKVSNDGMALDEVWHELAGLYPDVFDADISDADMPQALADIVSRLKDSRNVSLEFNEELVRQSLVREVYDSYWNTSTLYTVADVKQREINALKANHRERIDKLREDHREKVEKLHEERRAAVAAGHRLDQHEEQPVQQDCRTEVSGCKGSREEPVRERKRHRKSGAVLLQQFLENEQISNHNNDCSELFV